MELNPNDVIRYINRNKNYLEDFVKNLLQKHLK